MGWAVKMMFWISLITLPFYVYLFLRLRTALLNRFKSIKKFSRIWVLLPLVFIYSSPLLFLFQYFTGSAGDVFVYSGSTGWKDYVLYYPFWWALIFLFETLPYFLVADLAGYIAKINSTNKKWTRYTEILKISFVAFFFVYVPLKTHLDTNTIREKDYSIAIKNLSPELSGLKIGLVADLQLDRYTTENKLEQFNDIYKNLNSDLTVFAGDIVTSGKTFITRAVKTLCLEKSPLGNFACMGDHDYWSDPGAIQQGLERCGWYFLQNRHRVIEHKNKKILITGITQVYSKRISGEDAEQLLKNAPKADLKILLVHQPAEFLVNLAEKYGYDLFLAGHTHGGQIVNHIFGIPIAPSAFETHYYHGYYKVGLMQVIVSNGIGLSLAPMRYHSPAEIVSVKLISAN